MSWETVPFGSVCRLVNGKAFKTSDWSASGVPIIRIQNLNDLGKSFNFWSGSLDQQVPVRDGDLLLAWSGTPGTSFGAHIWHGPNAILNQHIFRCDLDRRRVTPEWARFSVNTQLDRLIHLAHGGVGLKHVTRGVLEKLEVPLPPMPEQRRIGDTLARSEALRTKRRAALAQLDTLIQAIFLDLFGDPVMNPKAWKQSPLKHCAMQIQIGPFGSLLHQEDYVYDGIPLINPMHIESGKIVPSPRQGVTPRKHAELKLYHLRQGDVIMGRRGEMGRCAIVTPEHDGLLCGTGSLFIRPDENKATAIFLQATLSSATMRSRLESFSLGATLPNLNRSIVEALSISLPPIELQHGFARRVAAVEKLKAAHRASLAELDALFSSLQHRAFQGGL